MKRHIAPIFTVCHKVIVLIMQDHQIRGHILMRRLMEFLIDSVLVIIVMYLLFFFDSCINQFNIIKQSLIIRFIPIIDRMNILYMRAEIFVRKSTQPVY